MAQMTAKNSGETHQKPHYTGDKETYVHPMFAGIAPQYDRMNHLLSFTRHKSWRRLAVRLSGAKTGDCCLDVCTGTGDFAVDLAAVIGPTGRVIAADFCEPMIRNGLKKTARAAAPITMMVANAEALPYPSEAFDVATVGFGVRNVANLGKAISEMARVVKPGGRVVVLEFNRPENRWYKPVVDLHLFHILPRLGGLFSRREAYTYLPESMKHFVSRQELARTMTEAGLRDIEIRNLNFGTVCIHIGVKPAEPQTAQGA